jgi:ribosomal protein L16/L10AE
MLRKLLKKFKFKRKIYVEHHRKFWFCLKKNYTLSKKSKNARMGKGKGKFLRWSLLVPRNAILLEFMGWQINVIKYICRKFNKKTFLNVSVFSKDKIIFHSVFGSCRHSYYVLKRYNCFS